MTALLVLGSGLSACSDIFGPEDVLKEFAIERVELEPGALPETPTAEVRGGPERIVVEGWVEEGGCSDLEPAAEKSGSTIRLRVHRRLERDGACPTYARPVRYRARLGPLEEGEYRLQVTLPAMGTYLESATFVFNVDVTEGLTG